MEKKPEPEDLAMLRNRFARTIEIWVAYNTFLNREIITGHDKTCISEIVVLQTTHTLLLAFYSFVYSLFDPSGTSLERITKPLLPSLPNDALEALNIALGEWKKIEKPITKIRNNIGFHHSPKYKGKDLGYQSYKDIHPFSCLLIMQALRVLFRRLDQIYEHSELYGIAPRNEDISVLMDMVRELLEYVEKNPMDDVIQAFQDFLKSKRA